MNTSKNLPTLDVEPGGTKIYIDWMVRTGGAQNNVRNRYYICEVQEECGCLRNRAIETERLDRQVNLLGKSTSINSALTSQLCRLQWYNWYRHFLASNTTEISVGKLPGIAMKRLVNAFILFTSLGCKADSRHDPSMVYGFDNVSSRDNLYGFQGFWLAI